MEISSGMIHHFFSRRKNRSASLKIWRITLYTPPRGNRARRFARHFLVLTAEWPRWAVFPLNAKGAIGCNRVQLTDGENHRFWRDIAPFYEPPREPQKPETAQNNLHCLDLVGLPWITLDYLGLPPSFPHYQLSIDYPPSLCKISKNTSGLPGQLASPFSTVNCPLSNVTRFRVSASFLLSDLFAGARIRFWHPRQRIVRKPICASHP
jgi:hypothetical protein